MARLDARHGIRQVRVEERILIAKLRCSRKQRAFIVLTKTAAAKTQRGRNEELSLYQDLAKILGEHGDGALPCKERRADLEVNRSGEKQCHGL
jgi:hypothetical protein